jgi:hypothetical protein
MRDGVAVQVPRSEAEQFTVYTGHLDTFLWAADLSTYGEAMSIAAILAYEDGATVSDETTAAGQ